MHAMSARAWMPTCASWGPLALLAGCGAGAVPEIPPPDEPPATVPWSLAWIDERSLLTDLADRGEHHATVAWAADGSGAVALTVRTAGEGNQVMYRLIDATDPVRKPAAVLGGEPSSHAQVVAVDDGWLFVWTRRELPELGARRIGPDQVDSSWSAAVGLGGRLEYADLVALPGGESAIVWYEDTGEEVIGWIARVDPRPAEPAGGHRFSSLLRGPPSLDFDGERLVVAWAQWVDGGRQVVVQPWTVDPLQPAGWPSVLHDLPIRQVDDPCTARRVEVAARDGRGVAAWTCEAASGHTEAWAQAFDLEAGALGEPLALSPEGEGTLPTVAMLDDLVLLAWRAQVGGRQSVLFQPAQFGEEGLRLGEREVVAGARDEAPDRPYLDLRWGEHGVSALVSWEVLGTGGGSHVEVRRAVVGL